MGHVVVGVRVYNRSLGFMGGLVVLSWVVGLFPLVLIGATDSFYMWFQVVGGWESVGLGLVYPVGLESEGGKGEWGVWLSLALGCMGHVGHGVYVVAVHSPCFG
jgi:hypothetical protein